MRSRAAAFADLNVMTDHVQQQQQQHTAAAVVRDVRMVVRNRAVEAAAAAAAAATTDTADDDNATTAAVDTLFHRSLPPPPATTGHQPPSPSPNRTGPAVDSDRVHHQPQSREYYDNVINNLCIVTIHNSYITIIIVFAHVYDRNESVLRVKINIKRS